MATSVTFEQENLTSPIKLTFQTIQRLPVEKGISLTYTPSWSPMVLWRDHIIGSFVSMQLRTHGLFLWNMKENSIFYFEVLHASFPSPEAFESQFCHRRIPSHAVPKSLTISSSSTLRNLVVLTGGSHTTAFTFQAL